MTGVQTCALPIWLPVPSCEITSVQIRLFWSLKRNETQDPNNVISLNLRYNWFEKSRWALFINIQRLYSLNLIIGVSGEREIRERMVAGTLGSVKVRVRAGDRYLFNNLAIGIFFRYYYCINILNLINHMNSSKALYMTLTLLLILSVG